MKKYKKNIALIFLAAVMLFCAIPFGVGATGKTKNAESQNRYNVTLTDDSPEYVREIAEKSQIYDEFEVVSLREENVKHFALADGTFKAVVYPYKIHEQGADGKWVETVEFENDNVRGNRDPSLYFVDASEDTYVSSYSPSSNYSSSSWLYVGTSTMRTYIKFDLPTLPANATITSCDLDICYWYVSSVTTGYVTVGVYEVESYWNDSMLTWNTVQYGFGTLASSAIATANLNAGTGITYSNPRDEFIDITEAVHDWYAGKTNYGIALEYMGGTNSSVGICSMEDDMYPLCWLHYTLDDLPVENGTYFINNSKWMLKYLQIDNNESPNYMTDGAIMQIYDCYNGSHQKWILTYLHNGYYKILSAKSGKALSVKNGCENTNGSNIVQYTYNALETQMWEISKTMRGTFTIKPKSRENTPYDYCVSVNYGLFTNGSNGSNVNQEKYVNNDNETRDEWRFADHDYTDILLVCHVPTKTFSIKCTNSLSQGTTWNPLIQASATAWNNSVGTNITVTSSGSSPYTCEVKSYNETWFGLASYNNSNERLTSAVIKINTSTCSSDSNSRKSTITHEIGHLLGLDDDPTTVANQSLMNHNRNRSIIYTPTDYDILNIKYIYGID